MKTQAKRAICPQAASTRTTPTRGASPTAATTTLCRWVTTASSAGDKTVLLSHLYIKTIILPRQARDKHRENSKRPFCCSGFESDWCYPCTDYFYPNASDPRGVSALSATMKVPGDDSTFLLDRFEIFLGKQIAAANPWLAHICFHAIHEPHPAMPVFWNMYATPGTNRGERNAAFRLNHFPCDFDKR
jgi:hypothetical protein